MADSGKRSGPSETSGSGALGTIAALAVLAVSAGKLATTPDPPPAEPNNHPAGIVLPEPKAGLVGRIDRFQRSNPVAGFLVGVVKKFGDDKGGKLAALIAYYGFFSLFPAMLALVTVLGFVLEGRDQLREDIANSALAQFPVIGSSLAEQVDHPLSGNPVALIIGIAGALWAGMGAMQAAQDAMNTVWDVGHGQMPNFFVKRLRSLVLLGSIGLLLIATAVTPQVIGAVTSGALADVLLQAASVVLSIVLFAIAFRVLTEAKVSWGDVMPGACLAGVVYTILQVVGRVYITRTVSGAEDTYGTFAIVIGLLSWMFLVGQVLVISAEVNVVRARRLWPRGLQQDSFTPDR